MFVGLVDPALAQTYEVTAEANLESTEKPAVVSLPLPDYPTKVKSVLLKGQVRVAVYVNHEGKVASTGAVKGPGAVCDAVTDPIVMEMRKAAAEAAGKAVFTPTSYGSTGWINYDFQLLEKLPSKSEGARINLKDVSEDAPSTVGHGPLNHKAIHLAKPYFPAAAKAVRATGQVPVQILIDTDGSVFSAEATGGHPLLRASAVAAACGSKFSPTLLSGKPVRVEGIISYNFVP